MQCITGETFRLAVRMSFSAHLIHDHITSLLFGDLRKILTQQFVFCITIAFIYPMKTCYASAEVEFMRIRRLCWIYKCSTRLCCGFCPMRFGTDLRQLLFVCTAYIQCISSLYVVYTTAVCPTSSPRLNANFIFYSWFATFISTTWWFVVWWVSHLFKSGDTRQLKEGNQFLPCRASAQSQVSLSGGHFFFWSCLGV